MASLYPVSLEPVRFDGPSDPDVARLVMSDLLGVKCRDVVLAARP
jgi:hypothetical protein